MVVGSGPCGAVVAKELADAGLRVVLLEEGPALHAGRLRPRRRALDGAHHARGRAAHHARHRDADDAGDLPRRRLARQLGDLRPGARTSCSTAGASDFELRADAARGSRSALRRRRRVPRHRADARERARRAQSALQARAATRSASRPSRSRATCAGAAAAASASPAAARARSSRWTSRTCRPRCAAAPRCSAPSAIEQVLVEGRRAVGVTGRVVAPFTGRPSFEVRVRARRVVLAAGCMATPVLLQKSGDLANASGQVGANLQFHPGVAMLGVFPDPVHPQFGATQGYQSLHYLREGFKLETLWAPPAVLAVRMPGSGLALKQRLARVPRSAVWDAIASCNRSIGSRARAQPGPGSEAHLEPAPGRRPDPGQGPPHAGADLLRGRGADGDPRRARDSGGAALAGRGRGAADPEIPGRASS